VDSVSRLKLHGSRLLDAEPGVTGDGCETWIELGRRGAKVRGDLRLGPRVGDGPVEAELPKIIKTELMLLHLALTLDPWMKQH
jgi:hypothetical protein